MTTLIAVYSSDRCLGRCDAKCYEAQSVECDCICGGRNHGAGLQAATEYTRERAREIGEAPSILEAYLEVLDRAKLEGRAPAEATAVRFTPPPPTLFEE